MLRLCWHLRVLLPRATHMYAAARLTRAHHYYTDTHNLHAQFFLPVKSSFLFVILIITIITCLCVCVFSGLLSPPSLCCLKTRKAAVLFLHVYTNLQFFPCREESETTCEVNVIFARKLELLSLVLTFLSLSSVHVDFWTDSLFTSPLCCWCFYLEVAQKTVN